MPPRCVLYVNQNPGHSQGMTTDRIRSLAALAKSIGADAISPKVGEGGSLWYDIGTIKSHAAAAKAAGVKYIPFIYSRADLPLAAEKAVLVQLAAAVPGTGISIDMEDTWDGRGNLAADYATALIQARRYGPIYISTWANPQAHGDWPRIIATWDAHVDYWCPQQYSDALFQDEGQWSVASNRLQPQLDLSVGEFGPDDIVNIAAAAKKNGHRTIWLWEDGAASGNPDLAAQVVKAFGRGGGSTVADVVNGAATAPGFLPIAQALNDAELMWPLPSGIASWWDGDWMQWAMRDGGAIALRGIIGGLGIVLIVAVLYNLFRERIEDRVQAVESLLTGGDQTGGAAVIPPVAGEAGAADLGAGAAAEGASTAGLAALAV